MTVSASYTPTIWSQNLNESSNLISWESLNPIGIWPLRLVSDLYHITGTGGPGPFMTDIQSQTTVLYFSGFNITGVPDTLNGVQMNLDILRNGRVCDGEIFLMFNGEIVGANQSNYDEDVENHLINFNKNVYGGTNNFWGVDLTPTMLMDPSFGIAIRLRSHPLYPHRSGCVIRNVYVSYYA